MEIRNVFKVLVVTLCLLVCFGSLSFARDKSKVNVVTEFVVESGPGFIQAGDYILTNYKSLWLNDGDNEPSRIDTDKVVESGKLIRAYNLVRDDEGLFWNPERVEILVGSAYQDALNNSAGLRQQEQFVLRLKKEQRNLQGQENNESSRSKQESKKGNGPRLIDGVWVN